VGLGACGGDKEDTGGGGDDGQVIGADGGDGGDDGDTCGGTPPVIEELRCENSGLQPDEVGNPTPTLTLWALTSDADADLSFYTLNIYFDDVVDGVRQAQEYEKRLKEEQRQRVDDITRRELEAQAQIEQRVADVEAQRLSGLQRRNNEPLKAADIRSSEGIGQFLALATGREDPAVAEARKQTNEIVGLRQDLRELQAQKAEIMGGA
jgi:hypothetical protein